MHSSIRLLRQKLFEPELLTQETGIRIKPASAANLKQLSRLYTESHARGDWFGSHVHFVPGESIGESFVAQILRRDDAIAIAFVDQNDDVAGATALYFDVTSGFLIDETQIDPIRGRRKGIMSEYFRRLVAALDEKERFWTEFVLTPGSAVLRRVLLMELGMHVTGLRPAAYLPAGSRIHQSVLVAHAPWCEVNRILDEKWFLSDAFAPLRSALKGQTQLAVNAFCQPDIAQSLSAPCEIVVSSGDSDRAAALRRDGFRAVAINPFERTVIMSDRFRLPQSDLTFLLKEGIDNSAALINAAGCLLVVDADVLDDRN